MHLSYMYGVARFRALLSLKRDLNAGLAATCRMLHDIFYMSLRCKGRRTGRKDIENNGVIQ